MAKQIKDNYRRSESFQHGLRELTRHLPSGITMAEIGTANGDGMDIFVRSGKVSTIYVIDPFPGAWSEAEARLDEKISTLYKSHPHVTIHKIRAKAEVPSTLDYFTPKSLDFVYIDAIKREDWVGNIIDSYLPKLTPTGYIGGHDYHSEYPGTISAVESRFRNPDYTFMDWSWLKSLSPKRYGIVSFCTKAYDHALQQFLPTWIPRNNPQLWKNLDIRIFVDYDLKLPKGVPSEIIHRVPSIDTTSKEHIFSHKINVIREYYLHSRTQYIAWIDIDCMITNHEKLFSVFHDYHSFDLITTRLLNRKDRPNVRKDINAGVLFFKRGPWMLDLLYMWDYHSKANIDNNVRFSEQVALSTLFESTFDNLPYSDVISYKPNWFRAALSSERIYNLEHDHKPTFLQQIKTYNPALIHFKTGWFRDAALMEAVNGILNSKTNGR